MGLCLIGALDPQIAGHWVPVVLMAALGLGFVIFVHELGHFVVAKLCGVKCDKFFLGFDVGGYKISRKWGETEYGIGVLPLGGYVKMMGQDDNPANIDEQLKESMASAGAVETKEIQGPDGKKYLVDKRSYLAKSVPQRMAIISAGVVMNIIFAFIFATIAYKVGVPYNPSVIAQTAPGAPSWQADIRPGDEVVELDDVKNPSFEDLLQGVMLGDLRQGVKFTVKRDGKEIEKLLRPVQEDDRPRVGIPGPSYGLALHAKEPTSKGTMAGDLKNGFEGGDVVVAVDGQKVASYGEFMGILNVKADQPLTIQVRRGGAPAKDDPFGPPIGGELVDVNVPPQPARTLGLVMEMGRVVAVQENSPAAQARIQPGDFIDRVAVDGLQDRSLQDPMALPGVLGRAARDGGEATLVVRRSQPESGGDQPNLEVRIPLRAADRYEPPLAVDDPLAASSLGVAYRVLNVVASVEPDSPAAQAGLTSGDVILSAKFIAPASKNEKKSKPTPGADEPIEFSAEEHDGKAGWPAFASVLQWQPAGTKVEITFRRGEKTETAVLEPIASTTEFESQRGMNFAPLQRMRIADSWSEAIERGKHETVYALGLVYRFLGKLGSRQISAFNLGGPLTIAQAAGATAFQGVGKFLVFLTMLSANLAVINFLPIPVLDGGHMAFLLWEGIRGKPAGEKFAVALQTVGFVFIVSLMLFVFSLDIHRLLFT